MPQTKLTNLKESILVGRMLRGTLVATTVFILGFIVAPYIAAESYAANTTSAGVTWNEVSLTLDPDYGNGSTSDAGHGDVDFGEIVPTTVSDTGNIGTMRVIKKNIGITTNGNYYTVFLSMAGTTKDLILRDSTLKIDAIDAYWDGATDDDDDTDGPSAFSATSWGFAVPTGDGENTLATPFSYNYSGSYDTLLGTDLTKSTHSSVYNQAAWAQVPTLGSAQQIWKAKCTVTQTRTCATTGFGTDSFPVYYGIMVDTDVMAGTYENEIVYTAMASSSSLDQVSTNINRSTEFVKQGTVESLSIDLSTSGVPLTSSDVEVYLVPHKVAADNNYNSTTGFSTYAINANKCAIGTGASDFVTTSHGLTLNCTLPASPNGIDDGTSTTTAAETASGIQLGEFDFWIHMDKYGYDYISKYTRSTTPVASIVYAGLQSKDANGDAYITKMQEMSGSVCRNTNQWGGTETEMWKNLGINARIFDYTGTGATLAALTAAEQADITAEAAGDSDAETELTKEALALKSDSLGLGTFALTDTRDGKDYLVRRLADGNCWMVQNLDLELADFAGKKTAAEGALTKANTDLAELDKDYWDPSESTVEKMALNGATTFGEFLNLMTGTGASGSPVATSEQFQSYDIGGTDHFWGTKCTPENSSDTNTMAYGACDYSATVSINGTTVIPRSYSNMVTSDQSTDFSMATQLRYIPTDWKTGQTRNQRMNASTGYPAGNPASFGSNASSLVTATSSFIPTIRATSSTGAAGASYEEAANGSYYGTMYIGHYYNWYAVTAETGIYSIEKTKDASICPKGWQLPAHEDQSPSYGGLILRTYGIIEQSGTQTDDNNPYNSTYGPSAAVHKLPISIPNAGSYSADDGTINRRGGMTEFWTQASNANNLNYARRLLTSPTAVHTGYGTLKDSGLPVRCVARD